MARFALTILGVSLWLSEFTVTGVHQDPVQDSDADEDQNDEASQVAKLVQGDDDVAGPQPKMPDAGPSTVSLATAKGNSSAEKSGWDAIKLMQAGMCVDMLTEHGENFDKKAKCMEDMDKHCGTNKITTPSGKGHCKAWYKLLASPPAAPPSPKAKGDDAAKAHAASETAKEAASMAHTIATKSIHLADNAKVSLEKARDAVHQARTQSAGLSDDQKHSLKKAEAKLKEATKKAEYGQLKNAKYVKAKIENKKLQKMEKKMDKLKKETSQKDKDELEALRREIEELRKELKKKEGDQAEDDAMLKELQDQIEQMEKAEKAGDKKDKKSHDELKAEIERLRADIKDMQDADTKVEVPASEKKDSEPAPEAKEEEEEKDEKVEKYDVKMKPLKSEEIEEEDQQEATPVEQKGIDIDTAMPYGDLEPFGREDTAQELTENSIQESNGMVDQLERAEVAEEKRSVFRALTRLRGAAITSFDGVARSQTGNIDEYNKVHKWRNNHPLHHLADEESDISKWAFPDNAD